MRTFTQRRTVRRTAIAVIAVALFALIGFASLAWRPAIAAIEPPAKTSFSRELIDKIMTRR